jgi:hypothetical protein
MLAASPLWVALPAPWSGRGRKDDLGAGRIRAPLVLGRPAPRSFCVSASACRHGDHQKQPLHRTHCAEPQDAALRRHRRTIPPLRRGGIGGAWCPAARPRGALSLCMPLSPQRPEEVRPHSKSFAQSPIWCAEAPQAHVAAPAPGGFCVSRAGQGEAEALAGCGLGRAHRAPDRRRAGWKSASTRSSWGWCCARARRRRVPKGLAGSPASCASPPAAAPSAAPSWARRRSLLARSRRAEP